MITYIILNSFLFLKLILFILVKIFLIPNLFSKYLLLIIFSLALYLCYLYPRKRFHKLSQLRAYRRNLLFKYALMHPWEHIYNLFILFVYLGIFIIGLFYLRYLNIQKTLDFKHYYSLIIKLIQEYTWDENVINCLLILLVIVLYITIIYKMTQYFKLHIIRRHIYLIGKFEDQQHWYKIFIEKFIGGINIHRVVYNIECKIENLYRKYYFSKQFKPKPSNYEVLSQKERDNFLLSRPVQPGLFMYKYNKGLILHHILTKWHYALLVFVICYDLRYHNWVIIHVFYLLPWTFFYELYIRMSHFFHGLWTSFDEALHLMLYCRRLEVIEEENILIIDGEEHDLSYYQNMYKYYIARGFVKDPEYI